jgi:pimeloyl-ACP methyl ester carboxylesterase
MPKLAHQDLVLHYQSAGDGDAVVLIHGLGANLAFWFMSIGRTLARRYRIITYDLRGHGASAMPRRGYQLSDMVADLLVLLDHLGVQRAHIVGHSFGARVGLAFTVTHPERVATLTVADTQLRCLQAPVSLREWPHWPKWRAELEAQGHTGLPDDREVITFELLAHFNQIAPGLANTGAQRKRVGPSLRRRDMGRRGGARWTHLMSQTSAREEFSDERPLTVETIRSIRAPTLAVFGELSHCMPSLERLRQLLPGCQVAIVPDAGHFHPAVKPVRFARILDSFLTQHASGSLEGRDPIENVLTHDRSPSRLG